MQRRQHSMPQSENKKSKAILSNLTINPEKLEKIESQMPMSDVYLSVWQTKLDKLLGDYSATAKKRNDLRFEISSSLLIVSIIALAKEMNQVVLRYNNKIDTTYDLSLLLNVIKKIPKNHPNPERHLEFIIRQIMKLFTEDQQKLMKQQLLSFFDHFKENAASTFTDKIANFMAAETTDHAKEEIKKLEHIFPRYYTGDVAYENTNNTLFYLHAALSTCLYVGYHIHHYMRSDIELLAARLNNHNMVEKLFHYQNDRSQYTIEEVKELYYYLKKNHSDIQASYRHYLALHQLLTLGMIIVLAANLIEDDLIRNQMLLLLVRYVHIYAGFAIDELLKFTQSKTKEPTIEVIKENVKSLLPQTLVRQVIIEGDITATTSVVYHIQETDRISRKLAMSFIRDALIYHKVKIISETADSFTIIFDEVINASIANKVNNEIERSISTYENLSSCNYYIQVLLNQLEATNIISVSKELMKDSFWLVRIETPFDIQFELKGSHDIGYIERFAQSLSPKATLQKLSEQQFCLSIDKTTKPCDPQIFKTLIEAIQIGFRKKQIQSNFPLENYSPAKMYQINSHKASSMEGGQETVVSLTTPQNPMPPQTSVPKGFYPMYISSSSNGFFGKLALNASEFANEDEYKKFKNIIKYGQVAPTRKGSQGIIFCAKEKGGFASKHPGYTAKIKLLGVSGNIRVHGRLEVKDGITFYTFDKIERKAHTK